MHLALWVGGPASAQWLDRASDVRSYLSTQAYDRYEPDVQRLGVVGDRRLFVFEHDDSQTVWASDGAIEGTRSVFQADASVFYWSDLRYLGHTNDWRLYVPSGTFPLSLVATDGTAAGTSSFLPVDDHLGVLPLLGAWPLGAIGDDLVLFRAAEREFRGGHLVVSDGTQEGTRRIVLPEPDTGDAFGGPNPSTVVPYQGGVVFTALTEVDSSQNAVRELWWTDGSQANTRRLMTLSNDRWWPIRVPGAVWLGYDDRDQSHVYRLAGDGSLEQVASLPHPRFGAWWPLLGNEQYLLGRDPQGIEQFWRPDESSGSLVRVSDFRDGDVPTDPNRRYGLAPSNDHLLISVATQDWERVYATRKDGADFRRLSSLCEANCRGLVSMDSFGEYNLFENPDQIQLTFQRQKPLSLGPVDEAGTLVPGGVLYRRPSGDFMSSTTWIRDHTTGANQQLSVVGNVKAVDPTAFSDRSFLLVSSSENTTRLYRVLADRKVVLLASLTAFRNETGFVPPLYALDDHFVFVSGETLVIGSPNEPAEEIGLEGLQRVVLHQLDGGVLVHDTRALAEDEHAGGLALLSEDGLQRVRGQFADVSVHGSNPYGTLVLARSGTTAAVKLASRNKGLEDLGSLATYSPAHLGVGEWFVLLEQRLLSTDGTREFEAVAELAGFEVTRISSADSLVAVRAEVSGGPSRLFVRRVSRSQFEEVELPEGWTSFEFRALTESTIHLVAAGKSYELSLDAPLEVAVRELPRSYGSIAQNGPHLILDGSTNALPVYYVTSSSLAEARELRGPAGTAITGVHSITELDDSFYFAAANPETGEELWRLPHGSTEAQLVRDIRPGPMSSFPSQLVPAKHGLFLWADDGLTNLDGGARRRIFFLDPAAPPCATQGSRLCLSGRFSVQVDYRTPQATAGRGRARAITEDTGAFWFFDQENLEVVTKVLDGRAITDHFWAFLASLSDVAFDLDVLDTESGLARRYSNSQGTFASRGDSTSLPDQLGKPAHPAVEAKSLRGTTVRTASTSSTAPCDSGRRLCLSNGRFEIGVVWSDFSGGTGSGAPVPLTDDTGTFWFFDEANLEVMIKIIDGRNLNGAFWVFSGGLSNVQYTLEVRDTQTGALRRYINPSGNFDSFGDTQAFPQ